METEVTNKFLETLDKKIQKSNQELENLISNKNYTGAIAMQGFILGLYNTKSLFQAAMSKKETD